MVGISQPTADETMGPYTFRTMDGAAARQIALWQYPPPYDVYNCVPSRTAKAIGGYLNPDYHYYSLWDAAGVLCAYCCYGEDARVPGGDYALPAVDIGCGLRPDLTGRGRGTELVEAVAEYAQRHWAATALRATVATFNTRVLHLLHKLGFKPVCTFRGGAPERTYVVLVRQHDGEARLARAGVGRAGVEDGLDLKRGQSGVLATD